MSTPPFQLVPFDVSHTATEHVLLIMTYVNGELHPMGSGFFLANQLAVTAKHVVEQFYKIADRAPSKWSSNLPFEMRAVSWPGAYSAPAFWAVTCVWDACCTDVSFLAVEPANQIAATHQNSGPWVNVSPPAVGEEVVALGYPQTQANKTEGGHLVEVRPLASRGFVTAVYEESRDRGFLDFPCFELSTHFVGGMSGGPIFNSSGQLCGVVCANRTGEPISWGSTLWSAVGTCLSHTPNGTPLPQPIPVWAYLRKHGTLLGHEAIFPRVYEEEDALGKKRLRLRPLS